MSAAVSIRRDFKFCLTTVYIAFYRFLYHDIVQEREPVFLRGNGGMQYA